MDKLFVSWDLFDDEVETLAKMIKQSKFVPEVIIAPQTGGWIPARVIRDYLGEGFLYNCNIHRIKGNLEACIDGDTANKKVLVIDDIADHGITLGRILKDYRKIASEIKTATIYYKPCSVVKPDWFVTEAPEDTWVVFPWERMSEKDWEKRGL